MGKVNIKINDIPLTVDDDLTILKAARLLDIKIPTLCYLSLHIVDDSKIHASCRVCVVEVKGRRNLVPSCSTKVTEGMEIYTHTSYRSLRKPCGDVVGAVQQPKGGSGGSGCCLRAVDNPL